MKQPITNISFNREYHAGWTKKDFIAKYRDIYPDADLDQYAKDLGLVDEPAATAPASTDSTKKPRSKDVPDR